MANIRIDRSFEEKNGLVSATQSLLIRLREIEGECWRLIKEFGPKGEATIKNVKSDIKNELERFAKATVSQLPGSATEVTDRVTFATVAFIDDRLIKLKWAYAEDWAENPLESDLFNSRIAGTEFFVNVEKLDKNNRVDCSIAIINYLFINLGFTGKFDPKEDAEKIEKYKFDLYRKGFGVEFSSQSDKGYIAASYKKLGEPLARTYLPTPRKFNVLAILSVALLVIGTHGIWMYFAKEIEETSNAIILTRFE